LRLKKTSGSTTIVERGFFEQNGKDAVLAKKTGWKEAARTPPSGSPTPVSRYIEFWESATPPLV
jgi:hypothetical protein